MDRIVHAFSGGPTSSAVIRWLADNCRATIVTLTVDVGQAGELDVVRDRALALGAVRAHVIDARDDLAAGFVLPALQVGALTPERAQLAQGIVRAALAKYLVQVAEIEGASTVAHGCRAGADRLQLETCIRTLNPDLIVLAPADAVNFNARQFTVPAQRHIGPPIDNGARSFSERTLLGRLISSVSPDPINGDRGEPSDSLFLTTGLPERTPDAAAYVDISFESGVPVAINGVEMSLVELIQSLETIAGTHGVGRIDIEAPISEHKASRTIYEAPAMTTLHVAYKDLQAFAATGQRDPLSSEVSSTYAALIKGGAWFSPARAPLDALVAKAQQPLSGVSRVRLSKGNCQVVARWSTAGGGHHATTPVALS
jgi:argininosuccinate synthase